MDDHKTIKQANLNRYQNLRLNQAGAGNSEVAAPNPTAKTASIKVLFSELRTRLGTASAEEAEGLIEGYLAKLGKESEGIFKGLVPPQYPRQWQSYYPARMNDERAIKVTATGANNPGYDPQLQIKVGQARVAFQSYFKAKDKYLADCNARLLSGNNMNVMVRPKLAELAVLTGNQYSQLKNDNALVNFIGKSLNLPTDNQEQILKDIKAKKYSTEDAPTKASYYKEFKYDDVKTDAFTTIDPIRTQIEAIGGKSPQVKLLKVFLHNEEVANVIEFPLYKVKGQGKDAGKDIWVDHEGRRYNSFAEWKTENRLPPGKMVYPADGELSLSTEGIPKTQSSKTPLTVDTTWEEFKQGAGLVVRIGTPIAIIGGLALGQVEVLGLLGIEGTTAATVGVGLNAFSTASTLYMGAETGVHLYDMGSHGQSINPFKSNNPEARSAWIASAALGLGLAGSLGRVTNVIKSGSATAKGMGIATTTAGLAATTDQGINLANNWDKLSDKEKLFASFEFAFYGALTGKGLMTTVKSYVGNQVNTAPIVVKPSEGTAQKLTTKTASQATKQPPTTTPTTTPTIKLTTDKGTQNTNTTSGTGASTQKPTTNNQSTNNQSQGAAGVENAALQQGKLNPNGDGGSVLGFTIAANEAVNLEHIPPSMRRTAQRKLSVADSYTEEATKYRAAASTVKSSTEKSALLGKARDFETTAKQIKAEVKQGDLKPPVAIESIENSFWGNLFGGKKAKAEPIAEATVYPNSTIEGIGSLLKSVLGNQEGIDGFAKELHKTMEQNVVYDLDIRTNEQGNLKITLVQNIQKTDLYRQLDALNDGRKNVPKAVDTASKAIGQGSEKEFYKVIGFNQDNQQIRLEIDPLKGALYKQLCDGYGLSSNVETLDFLNDLCKFDKGSQAQTLESVSKYLYGLMSMAAEKKGSNNLTGLELLAQHKVLTTGLTSVQKTLYLSELNSLNAAVDGQLSFSKTHQILQSTKYDNQPGFSIDVADLIKNGAEPSRAMLMAREIFLADELGVQFKLIKIHMTDGSQDLRLMFN